MLKEIEKRRSCRNFDKSKEVEIEKINEIVNAGLLAPSAINSQDGIVIVISNKEVRDKLMKLNCKIMNRGEMDPFYNAPVILLVAVKKSRFTQYDGSVMIENMLLEATHQGLASIWIHRAKEELETEEIKDIIQIPGLDLSEYEGIGHIALGYSLSNEYSPKIIKDNRAFFIR